MRHEQEVMLKKPYVFIFPSLPDPMSGVHCNKETFPLDLLEDTHTGKKRCGLVFYGVKSKILAYYIHGSKYPTLSLTLDALGNIIEEHGIHRMLITDSDVVLGAGKKWKHFLGRMFTPLCLSEPYKHNKTPFKRAIQNLKARLSKIRNACGTGALDYHYEMTEYLCDINNYVA